MRPDPSDFTFWHPVHVRFKDIDIGGHSHHSNALVYFEEARAAYWREVVGKGGDIGEVDFILAEARVRYHQRVLYPLRMRVGVRVSFLGKKHFIMEYLVLGDQESELLSGETTMVMFDYRAGTTKRIPPDIRAAVEEREGL